jgi:hypothetical protein
MQTLWREPLTRFLLIGVLLFAADHLLHPSRLRFDDEVHRIVVTASQQAAQSAAFRSEHGREPQPQELQERLDRWIDEQVLYREALALGLDRRDTIVQRQMTQKMRFLIENATLVPEPGTAELEAWLQQHPERYGHASTVNFQQVFLSRGRHGSDLAAEVARVQEKLAAHPDQFIGLGDPLPSGQVITGADGDHLRREFGQTFAVAMAEAPTGSWHGPLSSGLGAHLVRVITRGTFAAAPLAEVLPRVRVDWRLEQQEARNRAALQTLRARYRVDIEPAAAP